jgi:hypothetical protein
MNLGIQTDDNLSAAVRTILLCLLLSVASKAEASTTWFHGGNDVSPGGTTVESSQAITWKDGWASQLLPNVNLTSRGIAQFNQPDLLGNDQNILFFSFDGVGIDLTKELVTSARLCLVVDYFFLGDQALQLGVYGLHAADRDWVDAPSGGATWNRKAGAGSGWTGGSTLAESLLATSLDYGSQNLLVQPEELDSAWFQIDITQAFSDYLSGLNGGIALANFTFGDTFSASDLAFLSYTNDNQQAEFLSFRPGLLVETIALPPVQLVTFVAGKPIKLGLSLSQPEQPVTWTKEGQGTVSNVPGKITGAGTQTLSFLSPQAADEGLFLAVNRPPAGGSDIPLGRFRVVRLTSRPTLETPQFSEARVAEEFRHTLVATPGDSTQAQLFSATGLPKGLSLHPTTGVISGRPQASGKFKMLAYASNPLGRSNPVAVELIVAPLRSGITGSWVAAVAGQQDMSAPFCLGARVDLTVAASGSASGRLTLPDKQLAFTGILVSPADSALPVTGRFTISRPRQTPLVLAIELHPEDRLGGLLSVEGSVAGSVDELPVHGWRSSWVLRASAGLPVRTAVDYQGRFHALLEIPEAMTGLDSIPQGLGYAVITVASSGVSTWTGTTASGQAFAGTSPLSSNGGVLIHQSLASALGSLQGVLQLTAAQTDVSQPLQGTLIWAQKAVTAASTARAYRPGFRHLTLSAAGSRYLPPAPAAIILGLPSSPNNARLDFQGGGIEHLGATLTTLSPSISLTVASPARVTLPIKGSQLNPASTYFSVDASKGTFSGGFSLTDPPPYAQSSRSLVLKRTVLFSGLLVSLPGEAGQCGAGNFLCPALPTQATESQTRTPILAGRVRLLPAAAAPPSS